MIKDVPSKIKYLCEKHAAIISIISFIVGIGSIVIAIWISKQPIILPEKELTCILLDARNVLYSTVNDENIKLYYRDVEIDNPYIVIIHVENTGAYSCTCLLEHYL